MGTAQVLVRTTDTERDRWKAAAALLGRSVNQLVRDALRTACDALEEKHGTLAAAELPADAIARNVTRPPIKTTGPAARPQPTPSEQRPAPFTSVRPGRSGDPCDASGAISDT